MTSVAREERISLIPCLNKLLRLGESRESLKKQKTRDAAKQSLWTLLAVPLYSLVMIGVYLLKEWRLYVLPDMTESVKAMARQNYFNWIRGRFFLQDLVYHGNYMLQVAVLTALLFAAAQIVINKKLDFNNANYIDTERR